MNISRAERVIRPAVFVDHDVPASTRSSTFASVLIGDESLLTVCGDHLLARGHTIRHVVTDAEAVRAWAADHGIPAGPDVGELRAYEFDHLFSITNLRMLSAATLALPRQLAINYHDALLPQDAGVNATAWALWNRAPRHGITWHVMTTVADAGDILAQEPVAVAPDDTAFTLGLKCHTAAFTAFARLVQDLPGVREPQRTAHRRYHGRTARPPAALAFDWDRSAEDLDAAVRACDTGPHDNVFGLVKLWTGDGFRVVLGAEVLPAPSTSPPGTLTAPDTVATVTNDVRVKLAGPPLPVGYRFPALDPGEADRITAAVRASVAVESRWVDRMAATAWLDVPHRRTDGNGSGSAALEMEIATPAGLDDQALLRACVEYWGLVGRRTRFEVGLATGAGTPFAAVVPHSVDLASGGPAGDPGAPPLADVVLRYARLRDLPPAPIVVRRDETHAAPGAAVVITVVAGRCRWLVDEAVVDPADAYALRDGFQTWLAGYPDAPLTTRPSVLDPGRSGYPQQTVSQLVTAQAGRTPDAPALVFADTTLTYAEVDRRSAAVAAHLIRSGVRPGELVGVHLPRSADLVLALLGVLRAGAAYVPLDPIYPAERIAAMVADAGTRLVLDRLPDTKDTKDTEDTGDAADTPDRSSIDGTAYVIYTSGSTGRPKGVQVGHRALTNFLTAMAQRPGFRATDRLLAVTTVCFDIAALELFLPLTTGGCTEIVPAGAAADAYALRDRIERARPTVLQATPTTWKMLLAAGWEGDPGLTVLCGGEAMPPDLAEALLDRAGAVWNMYGPTETTIWSTVDRIRRAAPVTLGTPIANTVCAVLDDESRPLPVGVPGELCIGGDGVAHGYWNRPDLTADRFRETPLGRLYRTGDVVRLNHDGRLEFGGRADHQVKIRGFRIELGEIDAALTACPGIGQAVTVVRTDGTGEPRLVAYVTGTATIELKDVKSRLGRRLPDYMVPATIHVLDRMPLTLNGKIDRKALPEPSGEASGRAARTPAEETWCAVFAAALGVAHVGADQNLFALGGTSLTVTRVVATARDAGLAVTVRQVLAAPTPAALAGTRPAAVRTDLAAEVTLAPDIAPPPRHTLLTGATGFLGAFLLRDLSTHDIVTCLVRAHSPEYAWRRLRDATARYGLTVDERRLRVVPGDLARPHFGLGPDGFAELGAAVDRIVHCGATVNWLPSYADLKPVNVTGTEQVLRLAAARRLPVHHVSSMGVYAQRRPGVPRHTADTPTGPPADLITGYQQSKWVAEGLVGLARERGLPVSVYRVGRIGGDSRTGACQTDDYLWRILRGSVEAGIVPPAPGLAYDLSAVDHVSAAIVALADRHIGGDHHLAAPAPVRFDDLVTAVRAAGHPLTEVDPDKWADVVGSDPDNAAYMLADDFRATLRDPSRTEIALDPTETDVLLRRLGIESPPVDVAATIAHFQRTGFFPRVREDG